MAKLYPPQIEGTIPAFYGNTITVPYMMNKTVGSNDYDGFKLQFKSIMTNQVLDVFEVEKNEGQINSIAFTIYQYVNDENKKHENRPEWLKVGQSYKIQLAYYKGNEIGYYSTVGIVKYTNAPTVIIEGLETTKTNLPKSAEFIGIYSNQDLSEKAYSYCFNIYKSNGELYETSGELLHNYETEDAGDKWARKKELMTEENYSIQYIVTTINKMIVASSKYKIGATLSINSDFDININAKMIEEDGYIILNLIEKNSNESFINGSFVITRASSLDNFVEWTEINKFALMSKKASSYSFKDFTVQQGVTYKYAIQQYNKENQIYSNKHYSNELFCDFEHMYLFDGDCQLKIKFNPKVSSFKAVLQESKMDTMGGKYPFFFRNKNLEYKEFPISGLISYLADENQFFLKDEDIQLTTENIRTTNLEGYNIAAERIFRTKVLDFLNDGKPKLFRSPTEGNYIIRLMNSSLSPNDTVGRMLSIFNSTAYEIGECSSENLNKYGFIKIFEPDAVQTRFKTILAKDLKDDSNKKSNTYVSIGSENNIYSIKCEDFLPFDKIKIYYSESDFVEINIGYTGNYEAVFDKALYKVAVSANLLQGQITYSYKEDKLNTFDLYASIESADKPLIQFIGDTQGDIRFYNGYEHKTNDESNANKITIYNERLPLEDIKYEIVSYISIHATKREMLNIQKIDNKYYLNGKQLERFEPIYIYHYTETKEDSVKHWYLDGNIGSINNTVAFEECPYSIKIGNEEIDLENTYEFQLLNPEYIPYVSGSLGIIIEVSVVRRELIYDLEETDAEVNGLKKDFENNKTLENYNNFLVKLKEKLKLKYPDIFDNGGVNDV